MTRANVVRPFIAWDGEGATVRGRHVYTHFAGSGGVALYDPKGIPSGDALRALAEGMGTTPGIHVGFAIGYDVNLMLRGVRRSLLRQIWAGKKVFWSDRAARVRYGIEWRPRKFLWVNVWALTPRGSWHGTGAGGTWWDVWPFFQSSFVAALEKYDVGTASERDAIRAMKAERSTFTTAQAGAIATYNQSELRLLVGLMDALRDSVRLADMEPGRWDGPGALAALLLRRHEAAARTAAPVPDAVLDASQYAYYGGRIECACYGHCDAPVLQYDLNSAYPWAMQSLPCRSPGCGAWTRGACTPFAVYRVRWRFTARHRFYPLPWRSPQGGVFFPREGEGWAWAPELDAARAHVRTHGGTCDVLDAWGWVSTCTHPESPFAWIADAYHARQAAKARGDAAEHAIKLALNSLYGKLAQRVGARADAFGRVTRLPPFHDLAGAGFITSLVRARMYDATTHDPDAVCMLATDGIFSTRPLPLYPLAGKPLGAWSGAVWQGATIVQSGVYWLDDADGSARVYSRGFDADSLDRDAVRAHWHAGRATYTAQHTRFIGMGLALAGHATTPRGRAAFARWCSWATDDRALALHPWKTKRTPAVRAPHPARGLVATWPADTRPLWRGPGGAMTTASDVPWRPLPGVDGSGYDRESERALAESDDAAL